MPYYFALVATGTYSNNEIEIDYVVDKKSRAEWLNVALVERSVENQVRNGENKDRLLKHYNVVRKFQTIDLESQGHLTMTSPPNLDLSKCDLILFVQHRRNLRILGAAQVVLNPQ